MQYILLVVMKMLEVFFPTGDSHDKVVLLCILALKECYSVIKPERCKQGFLPALAREQGRKHLLLDSLILLVS